MLTEARIKREESEKKISSEIKNTTNILEESRKNLDERLEDLCKSSSSTEKSIENLKKKNSDLEVELEHEKATVKALNNRIRDLEKCLEKTSEEIKITHKEYGEKFKTVKEEHEKVINRQRNEIINFQIEKSLDPRILEIPSELVPLQKSIFELAENVENFLNTSVDLILEDRLVKLAYFLQEVKSFKDKCENIMPHNDNSSLEQFKVKLDKIKDLLTLLWPDNGARNYFLALLKKRMSEEGLLNFVQSFYISYSHGLKKVSVAHEVINSMLRFIGVGSFYDRKDMRDGNKKIQERMTEKMNEMEAVIFLINGTFVDSVLQDVSKKTCISGVTFEISLYDKLKKSIFVYICNEVYKQIEQDGSYESYADVLRKVIWENQHNADHLDISKNKKENELALNFLGLYERLPTTSKNSVDSFFCKLIADSIGTKTNNSLIKQKFEEIYEECFSKFNKDFDYISMERQLVKKNEDTKKEKETQGKTLELWQKDPKSSTRPKDTVAGLKDVFEQKIKRSHSDLSNKPQSSAFSKTTKAISPSKWGKVRIQGCATSSRSKASSGLFQRSRELTDSSIGATRSSDSFVNPPQP